MTTYYDAPEPDDLQRRCWIIDDGQCRLYNGHEGGHDFGGGGVHVHDYGATKVPCSRPECATSPAPTCLECGAVAFDPYAGACDKCGAEDRWLGSQWQKVPLATPDRADPERRAEGLDGAWAAVEAAVPGDAVWSVTVNPYGADHRLAEWRYEVRVHEARGVTAYERSRALEPALRAIAGRQFAALTPPPAGNELEEGK